MLPYVEKNVSKGRVYYRYRRNGERHPLPSDPSSLEFANAYKAIHESFEQGTQHGAPGTISELVATFRGGPDFKALRASTQRHYITYLDRIAATFGRFQAKDIDRDVIMTWRDSLSAKPQKCNKALSVMRRLLQYAYNRGQIPANHARNPMRIAGGSYAPWDDASLEAFRKSAPPNLVLAMEIALYTGQRQGDVLRMTWAQIKDGGIEVVQQKTGARLWVPLHMKLRAALSVAPRTAVTIITTKEGRPFKQDHFKHEWGKASKAAGITGLVFHGLRKTAASHMAEAGCTTEQIKAITGHTTDAMVAHYVRGANQRTNALAAMTKLELCPTHRPDTAQPLPNRNHKKPVSL